MEPLALLGIGVGCIALLGVVFSLFRTRIPQREEDRAFLEALRNHKPYEEGMTLNEYRRTAPDKGRRSGNLISGGRTAVTRNDTDTFNNVALGAMLLSDDSTSPRSSFVDCSPSYSPSSSGSDSCDSGGSSGSGGSSYD